MKKEVYDVLRELTKQLVTMYNDRWVYRLRQDELMRLSLRVDYDLDEAIGDCSQYNAHVWFDRSGRIWFLNNTKGMFPDLDSEWPFREEKDDLRVGSRYEFFHDIVDSDVMSHFQIIDSKSPIHSIYTWNGVTANREDVNKTTKDIIYAPPA